MSHLDEARSVLLGELGCMAALHRQIAENPPRNDLQAVNAARAMAAQQSAVKRAQALLRQAEEGSLSRPLTPAEYKLSLIEQRREI